MTARPGGTAVLAGAGLSVGAAVPAAWEVQRDLLGRVAAAAGDNPTDPFTWWKERTGFDAKYDEVLFATAPTPLARKDLLKPFFEPTDDERSQGIKVPSAGHRALAELMRDGLVRIILTLNFDLLIETALRDLGVQPTVVSTVADVHGMEPLHAQTSLVWHLHGDYTNPEMLNTPDELREYDPIVDQRLDELFDQYGLLIVGWSASWDPALRAAISRTPSRRYPTTWLSYDGLSDTAARLAEQRDATVAYGSADAWLGQLRDACTAVQARRKEPLTTLASVQALKRELALGQPAIAAHDRVQHEIERVSRLPVMDTSFTAFQAMKYPARIATLEPELETWAAFVAVLAYWGNPTTDIWWARCIQRFGTQPRLTGDVDAIESFMIPAVVTMYAGGVAAVAASRWDLVWDVLGGHLVPEPYKSSRVPAAARIGSATMYPSRPWPSRSLLSYIGPVLSDVVGLGTGMTLESWERFEYLNLLVNVDRYSNHQPSTINVSPYVRVDDDRTSGRRRTRPLASVWFDESGHVRDGLLDHLFDGSSERLDKAVDDADGFVGSYVQRAEDARLPSGGGVMPSGIRRAPVVTDVDQPPWP